MAGRALGGDMELGERVSGFIQTYGLIKGGERVLLAVSGGADSVCMVHLLCGLQEGLGVRLHIVHLDHMLRGAESEADARYVAQLARRLHLPITMGRRDVGAYRQKNLLSLEEAARQVRYGFFADVASSIGADAVLVGHTADDQVETILMHLVRGTGISGLVGMQPITTWGAAPNRLRVIRPLLEVTREEAEAYCRANDLEPRVDSSNLSPAYLRNRIRHELIPLLEGYNPNARGAILRIARSASDQVALLDEQVSRVWDGVVRDEGEALILDTKAVLSLPQAVAMHLLREVLRHMLGELTDVEFQHIDQMMAGLRKPAGKMISLPGGLVMSVGYDTCVLSRQPGGLCPFPPLEGEHKLNIPGETEFPGWKVRASIIELEEAKAQGFSAYLDLDAAGTDLIVRGRRPGDRFQPLGMAQPKKLQDFMVDAKIPRAWRDRVPLVCSPEHILWVVGWRIDERAKVKKSTVKVLHLEFERLRWPS